MILCVDARSKHALNTFSHSEEAGGSTANAGACEPPIASTAPVVSRRDGVSKPISRSGSASFKSRFLSKEKEKEKGERARAEPSVARTASKRFLDSVRGKKEG
jgi:hypothetical protein